MSVRQTFLGPDADPPPSPAASAFAAVEAESAGVPQTQFGPTVWPCPYAKEAASATQKLVLHLVDDDGEPHVDCPYALEVDGAAFDGKTDKDGTIEVDVPEGAESGSLAFELDGERIEYDLAIGTLLPTSTPEGARARLTCLGFGWEDVQGLEDLQLHTAIRQFQQWTGVDAKSADGALSPATCTLLDTAFEFRSGGVRRPHKIPDPPAPEPETGDER